MENNPTWAEGAVASPGSGRLSISVTLGVSFCVWVAGFSCVRNMWGSESLAHAHNKAPKPLKLSAGNSRIKQYAQHNSIAIAKQNIV